MRRALAIAAVLAACVCAVIFTTGSSHEGAKGTTYKIEFDNAFGLVEGGDFRIGGVKAGKTSKFEVSTGTPEKPPKAIVTAEVTEEGFDDLRAGSREEGGASCTIKPQSLIGEYYVDCQTGSNEEKLGNNDTVPVENNESTIPQDIVNNVLRRPPRERLRLIVASLGAGLAGRPEELREVLRRAHPGLRETSRVLRILGRQNRIIEDFIVDSDTVVRELESNKRDVVRWVRESADASEISASRRESIEASFERLPTFLDELRPTMARLEDLADEQIPLLADLERGAPHLNELFTRLGPFSEASRPAIRSLGRAAEAGTAAFNEGAEEVRELRRLSNDVGPASKPLRQLLQTLDDRRRRIEIDPRAKEGAPPQPDPTAIPDQGGFTGMEAFWNYWLWQGLSINGFDQYGHLLRVGVTITQCSEFVNEGERENPEHDEEFFEECNSWLGPYQPGINAPDFTANGNAARAAERPASRVGERRGEGQPDAGPLPGQKDISRPNIVLPPAVTELLGELPVPDDLTTGDSPRPRQPQAGEATQMLDYLLAP